MQINNTPDTFPVLLFLKSKSSPEVLVHDPGSWNNSAL